MRGPRICKTGYMIDRLSHWQGDLPVPWKVSEVYDERVNLVSAASHGGGSYASLCAAYGIAEAVLVLRQNTYETVFTYCSAETLPPNTRGVRCSAKR